MDYPKYLDRFCGRVNYKYDVLQPFVRDGFRYATDGRVCLRVPADGEPDSDPRGKPFPNAAVLFADFPADAATDWMPWLDVPPCGDCKNELPGMCRQCEGKGICSQCHCGHEHGCGFCDGVGISHCEKCLVPYSAPFGSVTLLRVYAYVISQLPDVDYVAGKDGIVWFRFAGGVGVVMGKYDD